MGPHRATATENRVNKHRRIPVLSARVIHRRLSALELPIACVADERRELHEHGRVQLRECAAEATGCPTVRHATDLVLVERMPREELHNATVVPSTVPRTKD